MEHDGLQAARWWQHSLVYLVLFALMLFWCREILDAPPYQDQSVGWQEANFLVETNFDFYRLRYIENHWTEREQGCRNYMTSLLPTVWAVLMKYSPSVRSSLIAAHVLNIALSCLAVTMVVVLTQPILGWLAGLLLAALVAATPLYHSQTEMVGMDIPMTAFAMVSLACVVWHRFYWAAFFAMFAFFMKPTGSLVTVATLIYLGILIVRRSFRGEGGAQRLFLSVAVNLLAFGAQVGVVLWGQSKHWSMHDSPSLATLSFELVPWLCPDLLWLFLASLVFSGVYLWQVRQPWSSAIDGPLAQGAAGSVLLLGWIIQLLVLLAVTRVLFIPRYLILFVPCLYVTFGVALFSLRAARPLGLVGGVLLLVFHVANTEGKYFPRLDAPEATFVRNVPDADSRSNAFLERSCEYRPELASARRACQVLEEEAKGRPIFTGNPYTRYLTLPRLGYVGNALEVYNSNYFDDAIRQYLCLARQGVDRALFVWAGMARANLPPPAPEDHRLYEDNFQDPLIVYEKSLPLNLSSDELTRWYLEQTRRGAWPITRLELRLPYLCETGAIEVAEQEHQRLLMATPGAATDPRIAWFPAELSATRAVGELLPTARQASDQGLLSALTRFMTYRHPLPKPPTMIPQIGEAPPRLEGCLSRLAEASRLLRCGRVQEGALQLDALSSDPNFEGQAAKEASTFLKLAQGREVDYGNPTASPCLPAIADLQAGRYQAAVDLLEAMTPKEPAATILLGIAYARLEEWSKSAEELARALSQRPDDLQLKRMLKIATQRARQS